MGRSSASCFKILACGGDSADKDDLEAPEGKGSSDKRRWSFRKRSATHRVLSNTVISETPPSGNKESPESATVNFHKKDISNIPEKTSAIQWTDEKPQLSTSVDLRLPETIAATKEDSEVYINLDESLVIVIQAAIRGFLAQSALLKHKNIVKLQAAVRGHLVRRHAVGTLRCVQAIIKMQALVRARLDRLAIERSSFKEKQHEKHGKDNYSLKLSGKENSGTRPHLTYTSIENLLSNGFARQLLESTPRTNPINIKCDPSKSDSAWKWLERWMSVSSKEIEQSPKPELSREQKEQETVEHSDSHVETVTPAESYCESADLKSINGEAAVPSESEENLITCDANSFDFQALGPTSSAVSHNLEQPQADNKGMPISNENLLDTVPNQIKQPEMNSEMELSSMSGRPDMESEQHKDCMKRFAAEEPETEGKQLMIDSRKASNPAFIAAQSKFEEMSYSAKPTRSNSSSNLDVGVESYTDSVSSVRDDAIGSREIGLGENSVSHASRVQVGGSECGTELSISSTLDSPDRSEVGAMDFEQEAKVLGEGSSNPNITNDLDAEAKGESTMSGTDLSCSISVEPKKLEDVNGANGEPVNSVIVVDPSQVEQKPEENASDVQMELKSEMGHQAYKSSPEASPKSHITIPESQGTPSSQISAKTKTRSDKSGSSKKGRSFSAGKKSPSNPIHDSGARSSVEQLHRDHKAGKRHNSFGSARPDHVDQEPRDSSSGNSLPNYMQATESARAKANANSSPRLSPDVQDKDIYVRKRHSLPVANGRQGSPRVQRSTSQAQESAKGNSTHPPPHERKWQR